MDRSVQARLERLRALRGPYPDRSDARGLFEAQRRSLERTERRLGSAASAWAELCPAGLVGRTAVLSVVRGILTVGVEGAPVRFELDRRLRGGLERELIRRCPVAVRGVRLVPWTPEGPGTAGRGEGSLPGPGRRGGARG